MLCTSDLRLPVRWAAVNEIIEHSGYATPLWRVCVRYDIKAVFVFSAMRSREDFCFLENRCGEDTWLPPAVNPRQTCYRNTSISSNFLLFVTLRINY